MAARADVRLTHPYVSPTTTLVLRNPKFSNAWQTDVELNRRRTVGGQLVAMRRIKWTKVRSLKVSFEAHSEAIRDAWLSFVELSAGQEIGFLDHEDRQWRGVILPGERESAHVGIGCQHEFSFEFRGEPV